MHKFSTVIAALCIILAPDALYAAPRLALQVEDSSGHTFANPCSPGAKLGEYIGTLTNAGDAPLSISSIRLEGGQVEDFVFDWNFAEGVRSLVSDSDPLLLYPEGSTLGRTSYSIYVKCYPQSTLSGSIATTIVVDSNAPDSPQLVFPVTADVVARPNIAIVNYKARLVRSKNRKEKDLVVIARLANVSPIATTRPVELSLSGSIYDKRRNLWITTRPARTQTTSALAGAATQKVSIRLKGIPSEVKKIKQCTCMEALFSLNLRVDPRRKILEGNEKKNGVLYDLEYSGNRDISLSGLSK